MDVVKAINDVSNLNSYLHFTQNLLSSSQNASLPFNMSAVLALKKIRSLEVEYFSKFQETGAAFKILELMLRIPPSNTWSLLAVEVINLLNYWVDALRKYLITHCNFWWTFGKALLGFIKEIQHKSTSVSNTLLKISAEGLLDLAANDHLSQEQRSEVLSCLNQICIGSSREIRMALQDTCSTYLMKLATEVARCRQVPAQFQLLELLMRWLPDRHERSVREAAAARWFPLTLYSRQTVAGFIERSFVNFYKDAREFLNCHNSAGGDIVSVVCRRLTVGNVEFISVSDKWESWLDIGVADGSLVAIVEPKRLKALGLQTQTRDHFTLQADDALQAVLYKESIQLVLSVTSQAPPKFTREDTQQLLGENSCQLRIWISSKCDLDTLDNAFKMLFGNKYTFDEKRCAEEDVISPERIKFSSSEEEARFSHPSEIIKPRKSGYVLKQRRHSAWKSQSSTSTTSLAHLQEKLSAFPRLRYDKEPPVVCLAPDLSCVTEISEPEEDTSITFSGKARPSGYRKRIRIQSKTSPSDDERFRRIKKTTPVSNSAKGRSPNCLLSTTIGAYETSFINDTLEAIDLSDCDNVVNLLAREAFKAKEKDAFLDSGIHVSGNKKTVSSDKEKIVDKREDKSAKIPCTIISKSSSDTSASFQNALSQYKAYVPENKADSTSGAVKSTTTDESNTETIQDTYATNVNVRDKSVRAKKELQRTELKSNFIDKGEKDLLNSTISKEHDKIKQFHVNDIEDFFSHHVQENKNVDLILSPTLARKINETSSGSSDSFDKYLISNIKGDNQIQEETDLEDDHNIVNPDDVFQCLNHIIDKVCEDLNKCTELMIKETVTKKNNIDNKHKERNIIVTDSDIIPDTGTMEVPSPKGKSKSTKVKLTYKNTKAKKAPVTRKNAKMQSPKNSIIFANAVVQIEKQPESLQAITPNQSKRNTKQKSQVKNRRKLYSPKDDDKQTGILIPETEDDTSLSTDQKLKFFTSKTTATSYKEIEKARKVRKNAPKSTRQPRRRGKQSRSPPLSPRSIKKNEIFDKMKEDIENVGVKLIDKKSSGQDITVYNFTSESDDEDFKSKKQDLKKCKGTLIGSIDSKRTGKRTPIGSTGSKRTNRSRKINYAESDTNTSADEGLAKMPIQTKKRAKKTAKTKVKTISKPVKNVIDEKMRGSAEEVLNTSFIVEKKLHNTPDSDLEPISKLAKRMEPIPEVSIEGDLLDKEVTDQSSLDLTKKPRKRNTRRLSLKKDKPMPNEASSANEECGKNSPLPALIIEMAYTNKQDKDAVSISSSKLIKKCEKVIKFGEEIDTTQNLLSDDDKINYSPNMQDVPLELEIRKILETNDEEPKYVRKEKYVTKPNDDTEKQNEIPKAYIRKIKKEIEATDKGTKTTLKTNKKQAHINICEVIEAEDIPSEISIPTIGNSPITAHGTMDEEPPNSQMLRQKCSPRDLNYDMSPSVKDFILTLNQQITFTPNTVSNKHHQPEKAKKTAQKQQKNLEKDLNMMRPTDKKSKKDDSFQFKTKIDSIPNSEVSANEKFTSLIESISISSPVVVIDKMVETPSSGQKCTKQSPTSLLSSPTVSLKKLTHDDIRKWLPSPKSSLSDESKEVFNIFKKRSKQTCKDPHTTQKPQTQKGSQKTQEAPKPKVILKQPKPAKKPNHSNNKVESKNVEEELSKPRKSLISPIRDIDEISPQELTDIDSAITDNSYKISQISSETTKTKIITKDLEEEKPLRYHLRGVSTKYIESETSQPEIKRKRKAELEVTSLKKKKLENVKEESSAEESGRWFREMPPSLGEAEADAYKESLQIILEKLDTTFSNITQHASTSLVTFLVDMHRQTQEQESKKVALLMSEIEKAVKRFMEGCATLDMEHSKARKAMAAELVRIDCQRRREFVNMLREDIEAQYRAIQARVGKSH